MFKKRPPRPAEAMIVLGNMYKKMNKSDTALSFYLKALQKEPENPQAHLLAGKVLIDLERPQEAEKFLLKGLKTASRTMLEGEIYLNLAYSSLKKGSGKDARQYLDNALTDDTRHEEILGTDPRLEPLRKFFQIGE